MAGRKARDEGTEPRLRVVGGMDVDGARAEPCGGHDEFNVPGGSDDFGRFDRFDGIDDFVQSRMMLIRECGGTERHMMADLREWATQPRWPSAMHALAGAWGVSDTAEELNDLLWLGLDEEADAHAEHLALLAVVARGLRRDVLGRVTALMRRELAVLATEQDMRAAEAAEFYKDQHRAVVPVERRLAGGDILPNVHGRPMAFGYFGKTWTMAPDAAARRGCPELAGRAVRYAYGKPVDGVQDHDSALADGLVRAAPSPPVPFVAPPGVATPSTNRVPAKPVKAAKQ